MERGGEGERGEEREGTGLMGDRGRRWSTIDHARERVEEGVGGHGAGGRAAGVGAALQGSHAEPLFPNRHWSRDTCTILNIRV